MSKFPHPPAVYSLHCEHDDSIEEWAVDDRIIEVAQRAVVVEMINKPIEKVVHHQHTLDGVKQEYEMYYVFQKGKKSGCTAFIRTCCLKPLPFCLRRVIKIYDLNKIEKRGDMLCVQTEAYSIALPGCHRRTS